MAVIPRMMSNPLSIYLERSLIFVFLNKNAANGGIKKSAITKAAESAIVLVNANGLNSLPYAPIKVNTGIKLIIVVRTAVKIAPETSAVAL